MFLNKRLSDVLGNTEQNKKLILKKIVFSFPSHTVPAPCDVTRRWQSFNRRCTETEKGNCTLLITRRRDRQTDRGRERERDRERQRETERESKIR